MPALNPGQTVVTGTPDYLVDALPPGTYRFQLVVEDDAGNQSLPVERVVTVLQPVVFTPQPVPRVPTQPEPIIVQPLPGVVTATPRVTATPTTTGTRIPLSTTRISGLRIP